MLYFLILQGTAKVYSKNFFWQAISEQGALLPLMLLAFELVGHAHYHLDARPQGVPLEVAN